MFNDNASLQHAFASARIQSPSRTRSLAHRVILNPPYVVPEVARRFRPPPPFLLRIFTLPIVFAPTIEWPLHVLLTLFSCLNNDKGPQAIGARSQIAACL